MALEDKTVLITGGCGQVGLAITQYLQSHHPTANIHILDLSPPAITSPTVTYHTGSINDASTISLKFSTIKPEIVFHTAGLIPSTAARLGLNTEKDFMRVNLDGTRILLEEAEKAGVIALVYTSSADVVKGNSWQDLKGVDEEMPIPEVFDSSYGKSKALAEALVLSSSKSTFRTAALRTHAVFSANDTNLLPLMLAAPRNLHLGPGTNLYDFTYAPNLAHAHILAAINLLTTPPPTKSAAGKAFFVTNAEPLPFRVFLKMLWTEFDGKAPEKGISVPTKVAVVIVWLSEKVAGWTGKKPVLTVKDLGDSLAERWFDCKMAKEVLGYEPLVTIKDALKEAAEEKRKLEKSAGDV
ncbi:NAD(P)-binding protein [Stipitochalara longipes BDJ]|nr:NAD(P)-binding protein [Stipitochalara longipes BDJ]